MKFLMLVFFLLIGCGKDSSSTEEEKIFTVYANSQLALAEGAMIDLPVLTDCTEIDRSSILRLSVKRTDGIGNYQYADVDVSITGKDIIVNDKGEGWFEVCRSVATVDNMQIPIVMNLKLLTPNAELEGHESLLIFDDPSYDLSFQFMTVTFQKKSPVEIKKIIFSTGKEIDIENIVEATPNVKLLDVLTSDYFDLSASDNWIKIVATDSNGPIYKYLLEGINKNYCDETTRFVKDAKDIYLSNDDKIDYIRSGNFRQLSASGENITPIIDPYKCEDNLFKFGVGGLSDLTSGKTLKTISLQIIARGTYSLNSFKSLVITIKNP